MADIFKEDYKKLNKEQKDAVDSIDGPVMVVAGPGTGKTQILALRIGNILLKTDTKADGILCLTFTNSAVKAMRERLRKYIGAEVSNVKVATFHSFGMEMLEKFHTALGLDRKPELMDDAQTIALCDEILHINTWEHIRPRSDASRYFRDLKSMISLLKRERITPSEFEIKINEEIKNIEHDPASISSRGESKGKLKKDTEKKIESLHRSIEAMSFYSIYEEEKKEKNLFDYDDILESLNRIVEESDEARDYIKENYLYVLIDEHQDSSGVQNEFLERVWKGEDKPNIFVVGDDRQLIYGFGGASLDYFKKFENTFGKAKQIFLTENYRSTANILEAGHSLIESSIIKSKLKSNHKENHALQLVEAYYPRDEIIACALDIKERINKKENPDDMAILVPKNRHVRSTITILKDMGIPVSAGESQNLFDSPEAIFFLQVLKTIASPDDGVGFANSFFNKFSGVPPFKAHAFIKAHNMRDFSLLNVEEENSLFADTDEIQKWIGKIKSWVALSTEPVYQVVQKIGTELFLDTAQNHEELVIRIEVIRTLLHLVLLEVEKNPKLTLTQFIEFMDRIESYGENIPLALFSPNDGVKVLTLHGSKGLEFDYVWIAHMDERSFSGTKVGGFSLPASIKEKVETRDEEVSKRQLYVAITRAKRFCTISYALKSYTGADQELAHIVSDISDNFEKQSADETEKIILKHDPKVFAESKKEATQENHTNLETLTKLVAKDYEDRKVSVSLLNNFYECTWKWYFRNLLQLPQPKSDSLEFGNMVHGAIDKILKLNKIPTPKELEEITAGNKEVLKIISNWVDTRLRDISVDREPEQSVSVVDDKFPHLSIYGKIDLIEKISTDDVRVTDFKTGGVRKKSDIEKLDEEGRLSGYLRQLAMYSYLLTKSPKWKVSVSESQLEFVEAKKEAETFYKTFVTPEQIEMIRKDIADYDQLVKTGQWVDRPCHYNSYGKNTECEYCKMAEIYTKV